MSFPGKGNTKSTYALLRDEKAASTQAESPGGLDGTSEVYATIEIRKTG